MLDLFADGSRIEVVANDPWDFVDADGSNVFQGQVVISAPHEEPLGHLLLRFDRPVVSQGAQSEMFVAVIEHQRPSEAGVECSLLAVDPGEVEGHSLEEVVSRWRGGLSARVTLHGAAGACRGR